MPCEGFAELEITFLVRLPPVVYITIQDFFVIHCGHEVIEAVNPHSVQHVANTADRESCLVESTMRGLCYACNEIFDLSIL